MLPRPRAVIEMQVDFSTARLWGFNEVCDEVSQRILVVCVGNICRSPTAEILFRHYSPGSSVASAGICALGGNPMEPTAMALLDEHGLDGHRHVARQLHGRLVRNADLILGMEQSHVDMLECLAPKAEGRIFLLDQWRLQADIPDPFGQPRSAFEDAYRMIDAAVQAWLPHLSSR